MSLKKAVLDKSGHFGEFGGRYVPEILVPIMDDLRDEFFVAIEDDDFMQELQEGYRDFIGRPSPLLHCKNLSEQLGGAQIHLKNEGLNQTGAHKINHCYGQALVAKRMGKRRVIAETGAGQHGVATATVCARLGLECVVYMGAKDYDRQRPNVFWMEKLGAKVVPVHEGGEVLKDAINAALRDLIGDPLHTHYLLGTVCGPNPYPVMNTFFQKVVGEEVARQMKDKIGRLPDVCVASVGGGSNAMGLFTDFLDEKSVRLIGVEAGGKGIKPGQHAARFKGGKVGVVEGFKSMFLQDDDGQIGATSSISAGLDYSGVGPQLAYLQLIGRVEFTYAKDDEVMKAYDLLAKTEGIFAAMESSHAVAEVVKLAPKMKKDEAIVFNCSGRGDKDLFIVTEYFQDKGFKDYLKKRSE